MLLAWLTTAAFAQSTVDIQRVSASHWTIASSIVIDRPADQVWAVLTDFEHMAEWSSSLQSVQGDIRDGGVVAVRFQVKPGRVKEFQHHLLYEEGAYFGWQGDPFAAGMTDHHIYRVVDLGDGRTRLEHSDEANGGMAWLLGGKAMKAFEGYCTSFNEELKARVEAMPPAPEE